MPKLFVAVSLVAIPLLVGEVTSGVSAYEDASQAIDSRIFGKYPATDSMVYIERPFRLFNKDAEKGWLRNGSCWVSDLDTTGVSPFNDWIGMGGPGGGEGQALVAISPWHLLGATHSFPQVGEYVLFVDEEGDVVSRTIVASDYIKPAIMGYPDIRIALLDKPLPGSIGFVKVLPDNWKKYLKDASGLPVLMFNLEEKAVVAEIALFDYEYEPGRYRNIIKAPRDFSRMRFFVETGQNDSGSQVFLVLDDQLVLINVLSMMGPVCGTSIVRYKDDINEMMAVLFDATYPEKAGSSPRLIELDMAAVYDPAL